MEQNEKKNEVMATEFKFPPNIFEPKEEPKAASTTGSMIEDVFNAAVVETVKNDDDIKGEALIKMGLGIRSSFMSCWALTHYSKSEYNPWFEDKYTLNKIAYANSLMEQGLVILNDPELAARYHQSLCQWRTAVEKFPETSVAEEIRTSCDNIVNYRYNPPKARDTGEYVNLYCW
jgi:hypothetical protein